MLPKRKGEWERGRAQCAHLSSIWMYNISDRILHVRAFLYHRSIFMSYPGTGCLDFKYVEQTPELPLERRALGMKAVFPNRLCLHVQITLGNQTNILRNFAILVQGLTSDLLIPEQERVNKSQQVSRKGISAAICPMFGQTSLAAGCLGDQGSFGQTHIPHIADLQQNCQHKNIEGQPQIRPSFYNFEPI